jgi:hypothetical protein
MSFQMFASRLIVLLVVFLVGCAANQMHGYQDAFYKYDIPPSLVDQVRVELRKYGLNNAQIARDSVGRLRLVGSYRDEDEVDRAFIIVQSIVGIKSTSPFYPDDVKEKRWEIRARQALEQHIGQLPLAGGVTKKYALIVGINTFLDSRLTPIFGEDDGRRVKIEAEKAGYSVVSLFGPNATKSAIESALGRLKQAVKPNDSLFIYISSHGNLPVPSPAGKDTRKMSIAAYDTGDVSIKGMGRDFQLRVHATSVSDVAVQELAQLPTRQTRVMIDTCYSGEILTGIPDDSSRYILASNGGVPERASISLAAWTGEAYGSKGIVFSDKNNLDMTGKVNPNSPLRTSPQPGSRYTIITATSDGELSWGPSNGKFDSPAYPGTTVKGSFFTQAFFDYLSVNNGQLEPAFRSAQQFTYNKAREIPPPVDWKGPVPIPQRPRMEPPLPVNDAASL